MQCGLSVFSPVANGRRTERAGACMCVIWGDEPFPLLFLRSETFCVGEVDADAKKLIKATYDCWR